MPTCPRKEDGRYSETGLGARPGLNILNELPLGVGILRLDDFTAMMYSDLLSRLEAHISRAQVLKIKARDSAYVRRAKKAVKEQLLDLEGRAHALCEYAMAVNHVLV